MNNPSNYPPGVTGREPEINPPTKRPKRESRSRKVRLVDELLSIAYAAMDPEEAHVMADAALLKYIDDPEVTIAWKRIKKWYA